MKICVAQIKPLKGDVEANIISHKRWIEKATVNKPNAIFFPELSITGYEPELAKTLATIPDDICFNIFQQLSDTNNLTISIGMPTLLASEVLISTIIFQPYQERQTYSKQLLHEDELAYFVSGTNQLLINIDDTLIAPAICYESLLSEHAAEAHRLSANVYMASVAKSVAGVDKAAKHYPAVARNYAMIVGMANSVGYCDNFLSAGNSAFWDSSGKLVGQLNSTDEGILIYDTQTKEVCLEMEEKNS